MAEQVKKRSGKSGLPPGSLVHIGEKRTDQVKITVMDYDDSGVREEEFETIEHCFVFKDRPSVSWINVEGLHNVANIQKLGDCYGFHPLVLEDILNTEQRPKMEDFGEYIQTSIRLLQYIGGYCRLFLDEIIGVRKEDRRVIPDCMELF